MAWRFTRNACAVWLLFALGACGPSIDAEVDDEGSADGSSGTAASEGTSTVGTLSTTSATTDDTTPDVPPDPTGHCEMDTTLFEVPRSVIEPWLNDDDQVDLEDCWAACDAAGLAEGWLLDCEVMGGIDPDDATTGDDPGEPGDGTDGTTSSDTDDGDTGTADTGATDTGTADTGEHDPLLELACTWEFCWGGGPQWEPPETLAR